MAEKHHDAEVLMEAAGQAYEAQDLAEVKRLVDLALELRTDWPLRGKILHTAGIVHGEMGDYGTAMSYYQQYLAGQVEAMSDRGVGIVQFNLGMCYRVAKNYYDAARAFMAAVERFTKAGDRKLLCWALTNLGWVGCFHRDLVMAREATADARKVATDEDIAHLSLNDAHIALLEGDLDTAETLCLNLLEQAPAGVRCHAYWLQGQVRLRRGDVAGAAEMARKAAAVDGITIRHHNDITDLEQQIAAATV